MQEVLANQYLRVNLDEERDLIWYKRLRAPFPSVAEAEHHFLAAGDTVLRLPRLPGGLLFDLREGPLRSDQAAEEMFERIRSRVDDFFGRFARVAVLVRTAVGELQISRRLRERGGRPQRIFYDEGAALAYLSSPSPAGRSSP
jgi:hypothetical protein